MDIDIVGRLERIEAIVVSLAEKQRVQDWYTTGEFAAIVDRSEFTVREYCRHGRVNAKKRASGRGSHCSWVISHQELVRFQHEGLLPLQNRF